MSVRAFYDALAPRYDAARFGTPYARFIDGVERAFIRQHCQPGTVLELGAGTGRLTSTLAELAADVTAVDVSPEMLRALRGRLPGASNVHCRELSVFDIPELQEFGRFDSVVSFRMLSHLPDWEAGLTVIQRALRPGGTAIFDLWSRRSLYYLLRTVARRGGVYTRFLSPAAMTAAIIKAGFRVDASRSWGFLIPLRMVLDRLDERRVVRLAEAVERLGCTRFRGAGHAVMFACVKPDGDS